MGHSLDRWRGGRQMGFRIITILLLLPLSWSIRLSRELTLNPSRKIIFSYWMFLVEKLSICLLPLSILYLCRRKMIRDKKKWTSPHQIYFSWIAVTQLTKSLDISTRKIKELYLLNRICNINIKCGKSSVTLRIYFQSDSAARKFTTSIRCFYSSPR